MTTTATRRLPDETPVPEAATRRRPSRRVLLLAGAGAVVLAVLVTYLVAFSPVFGVRTVDVRGDRQLSAAQIRAAAHIEHGEPLVRLDTAAVTRRVESLPLVESAQVSTSFPSTVTITVVERTPVGYVRGTGGDTLIDADGVQYRTVRTAPAGLPRFDVAGATLTRPTAVALGTVAAALTPQLRREVTSIQAMDAGSVTLVVRTSQGTEQVRWGTAARSRDKARLLPVLLRQPGSVIDLTDPDQPYVR